MDILRYCWHSAEAAGSFGRAGRGPTPPSSTAAPSHTPPRRGLRGVQPHKLAHEQADREACRRSGRRTGPGSHTHTDTARLHRPHLALGCQAIFRPPIGAATRSHSRCALPHLIAPQGAPQVGTGAAALCPCRGCLPPRNPLQGTLRIAYAPAGSAAVPLLPAPEGGADGVCLSTGFSPSLHGFAMSCPRAPASRLDP